MGLLKNVKQGYQTSLHLRHAYVSLIFFYTLPRYLLEQHLGAKALEALLTRLRTEAGKLEVFNIDNLVLPRYQKEEQPPDP
jgi:hypothetical protein